MGCCCGRAAREEEHRRLIDEQLAARTGPTVLVRPPAAMATGPGTGSMSAFGGDSAASIRLNVEAKRGEDVFGKAIFASLLAKSFDAASFLDELAAAGVPLADQQRGVEVWKTMYRDTRLFTHGSKKQMLANLAALSLLLRSRIR